MSTVERPLFGGLLGVSSPTLVSAVPIAVRLRVTLTMSRALSREDNRASARRADGTRRDYRPVAAADQGEHAMDGQLFDDLVQSLREAR
ncbi:hypothetical protein HHL24_01490 [Paraburkholderia sp. RP-4-7]|jgi:hypothetical protein|uniref:Uncharacterized protein n=1 Tax=Paraburkholderia polaris TaxID=2728848 RepID=A0A848I571_9BURK|nr:hypothetical protein [Paraburkholderia polaris]NML96639.1 hypothetical protein [Paraburkholderia polaris]